MLYIYQTFALYVGGLVKGSLKLLLVGFLTVYSCNAFALLIGLGDPMAGGISIMDNDPNDTNPNLGIIAFNQDLGDFTATGRLFRVQQGMFGATINRLVLTDLTVQAKLNKNIINATITFADTFQAMFPLATLVHLSGRYFHIGGGMIGGADIALSGFVDNLVVGDTPLGIVDPLAVANAVSPQNFTYPQGKGATEKKNLNGLKITGQGGLLTFSLNSTDGFVLPNSAEVAISELSDFQPLTSIPEPSTVALLCLGLISLCLQRARGLIGRFHA